MEISSIVTFGLLYRRWCARLAGVLALGHVSKGEFTQYSVNVRAVNEHVVYSECLHVVLGSWLYRSQEEKDFWFID